MNNARSNEQMLLAAVLASSILIVPILPATAQATDKGTYRGAKSAGAASDGPSEQAWRLRESAFYNRNWGVDIVGVRLVSSGHMLEFRYRILDSSKAEPINDKKAAAYLVDEKTGIRLTVPTMEKVGQLRQTAPPKKNQTYWMVFANEGKVVRVGDRVDITIGKFRVHGLVVE